MDFFYLRQTIEGTILITRIFSFFELSLISNFFDSHLVISVYQGIVQCSLKQITLWEGQ